MAEIKPIETRYKGHRFRSRLEARWAVFFDSIGIEWEYEPEGFELPDGTRYLPDFYLPRTRTYAEVKPPKIGCVQEIERACRFVGENGIKRLIILSNIPDLDGKWPYHPIVYYDNLWLTTAVEYIEFPQGDNWCTDYAPAGPPGEDDLDHWLREMKYGEIYYSDAHEATEEGIAKMYELRALKYEKIDECPFSEDSSFAYEAYAKAKAARFEFGEEG